MSQEKLYKVEVKYRRPDCCILNRFYWVEKSLITPGMDPADAKSRIMEIYRSHDQIQVIRITEMQNENHD